MEHHRASEPAGRDSPPPPLAAHARRAGGARQRLTRDLIVAAALDLVDEYGLELFSMRRLARRLGVAVMALYRYFPARDDLLADLARHIFDAPVPDSPDGGDWRERLVGAASGFRHLLLEHPNALPLLFTHGGVPLRPRPSALAMLEAFERAGLDPKDSVDAWRALGAYVVGYVNVERMMRVRPGHRPQRASRQLPPALARIAPYLDRSWEEQFVASLQIVLDGIAKLVESSAPARAPGAVRTSGRRGDRSST